MMSISATGIIIQRRPAKRIKLHPIKLHPTRTAMTLLTLTLSLGGFVVINGFLLLSSFCIQCLALITNSGIVPGGVNSAGGLGAHREANDLNNINNLNLDADPLLPRVEISGAEAAPTNSGESDRNGNANTRTKFRRDRKRPARKSNGDRNHNGHVNTVTVTGSGEVEQNTDSEDSPSAYTGAEENSPSQDDDDSDDFLQAVKKRSGSPGYSGNDHADMERLIWALKAECDDRERNRAERKKSQSGEPDNESAIHDTNPNENQNSQSNTPSSYQSILALHKDPGQILGTLKTLISEMIRNIIFRNKN
jgi:hypothetical protein